MMSVLKIILISMLGVPVYAETITDDMTGRYERAQYLMNMFSSGGRPVLNSTLYPVWIDGSDSFWYERLLQNGSEYRLVNAKDKTNVSAFTPGKLAEALAKASGQKIAPFNLLIKIKSMTLEPRTVTFTAFGNKWLYEETTGTVKKTKAHQRLNSPDGKYSVFLKNYNIWLEETETGKARALTLDGEQLNAYGAMGAPWGWLPGTGGDGIQVRWSPDGMSLFTIQRDLRQVKDNPVIDFVPDNSVRPGISNIKFAVPGDKVLERYRLVVIDIATGKQMEPTPSHIPVIDTGSSGFFDAKLGWWSSDSKRAFFIETPRGSQSARVLKFNVTTGDTQLVFQEKTTTHFKFTPDSQFRPLLVLLPETEELIWFSERSGWAHLYLYDLKTGRVKNRVTAGNWQVRGVLHFDAKCRELLIETAGRVQGRNPYYRDIARVNIDDGTITTLVSSNHDYITHGDDTPSKFFSFGGAKTSGKARAVSPSGQFLVTTRSRVNDTPVSLLFNRDGTRLMEIEKADISRLPKNWQWPEPVKMVAADGKTDIYGVIFRPSNFDPNKHYPILDYTFTEVRMPTTPTGAFTNDDLGGLTYTAAAAYAELGFIVVIMDGRGSAYRHKAFQDESYGWLPSANNMADHVAGIQQLAKRYPYMDLGRVGTTGHWGLSGAFYALLDYPDFYKAGVINAPNDTRLMPVIWGERHEGLKPVNPETIKQHYTHNLHKLKGKLLLIHNMQARYNPVGSTWRIIDALQKANRDFDMLILPKKDTANYSLRRSWDYLVKHLMGEEPPKEFNLSPEER